MSLSHFSLLHFSRAEHTLTDTEYEKCTFLTHSSSVISCHKCTETTMGSFSVETTLCPNKNIPNIFDCNLKTDDQILIIFNGNIPETTGHQTVIQFPTSPRGCFCTTWKNRINRIWHFYPKQNHYLTRKQS